MIPKPVPQTPREEYAEYPYEIEWTYDDRREVRELEISPKAGENPISYINRYLEAQRGWLEQEPNERLYRYTSSIYPREDRKGVILYINVDRIPDDAVGAQETRLDFVIIDNQWTMDWAGARHLCQRPNWSEWRPADQLCP